MNEQDNEKIGERNGQLVAIVHEDGVNTYDRFSDYPVSAADNYWRDTADYWAGVRTAWLVTTNDNLAALALYQRVGWRLTGLRAGAIDELRRTIKPSIPELGQHGIPLRDELELQLRLEPGPERDPPA